MSDYIQNILQNTIGDGARSTKFEAFFAFTDTNYPVTKDDQLAMCKTASFPGKSHTTIDLKFKGRSIPIKGQTKYTQTWECTFYLTEDHRLKKAFENWIEALDQQNNYLDVNSSPVLPDLQKIHAHKYTTELNVYQRNFADDNNTAEYILHNAFPTEVSQVSTNYESRGELLEFTVTFAYSHFTSNVLKGIEGNFVDEIAGKAKSAASQYVQNALSNVGDSINNYIGNNLGSSLQNLKSYSSGLQIGAPADMPKSIFDVVGR